MEIDARDRDSLSLVALLNQMIQDGSSLYDALSAKEMYKLRSHPMGPILSLMTCREILGIPHERLDWIDYSVPHYRRHV
jgi:hypothetical protein